MMSVAELTNEVREDFLKRNANLLALTRAGAQDVMRRISASLALNEEARNNVEFFANEQHLNQTHQYAREVARKTFKNELYTEMARAFVRVQHNLKIIFVTPVTTVPEALEELYELERIAGIREPLPPAPTQQELAAQREADLEAQVKEDWLHLGTAQMKAKVASDSAYRAVFNRLME